LPLSHLSRVQPPPILMNSRLFKAFCSSLQLIALGAVLAPAISVAKPQYGYTGDVAPEKWGSLSPEYAKCTDGSEQAPVNIVSDGAKSLTRAAVLKPSYPATAGDVVNTPVRPSVSIRRVSY
jgi:carbonic anhydrase